MNTFKKALLTSSIGLALGLGAGQAQAVTIDLSGAGPLSIKFDFYSTEVVTPAGRVPVGYTPGADNPPNIDTPAYGGNVGGGATYPSTTTSPNIDPPFPIQAGTAPGNGTLNETTFGVGRITSIVSYPTGVPTIWNNGDNGKQLAIFVYGVADKSITYNNLNGDFSIGNVGCVGGSYCDGLIHLDIYELTTAEYAGVGVWTPADRYAFDEFAGITDLGPSRLWAATTFSTGADGIQSGFDLVQTTKSATLPTTGNGSWLANCVAGPACAYLDTNGQAHGTDLFGQFTIERTLGIVATNGWQAYNNDPIIGDSKKVPEPGFLTLFGGGLLGMSFFRRFANRRG